MSRRMLQLRRVSGGVTYCLTLSALGAYYALCDLADDVDIEAGGADEACDRHANIR